MRDGTVAQALQQQAEDAALARCEALRVIARSAVGATRSAAMAECVWGGFMFHTRSRRVATSRPATPRKAPLVSGDHPRQLAGRDGQTIAYSTWSIVTA